MRIIVRGMGNLRINFAVCGTFRSRLMGQHLSDASRDLATLTFDLGGHGDCRWCRSSYFICVPSFKFVGLSDWYRYDALLVSALVDLVAFTFDFWPWNWCALLPMVFATILTILMFLRRFVLDVSANTCQPHHVTLRPWHLTLEVTALVGDAGLRAPSVY